MISQTLLEQAVDPCLDRAGAVRTLVEGARRIIVKVGSSVSTSGSDVWAQIAGDLGALLRRRKRVVVVASGAVALGRPEAEPGCPGQRRRRAWASVGQMRLTALIERNLHGAGLRSGQVLVRHADSRDMTATRRLAELLDDLCDDGIVPMVNEDDSHRDDIGHFADNDQLAAWLGGLWRADLIVFLTDVEGVYDGNPALDGSRRLGYLERTSLSSAVWGWPHRSPKGTGGMRSKVRAARRALDYGCNSIIASGLKRAPLTGAQETGCCTIVCHAIDALSADSMRPLVVMEAS
jgi:glutamate 5-kinase